MDYLLLRRVLAGVLLGTVLFFAPFFVIKIFVFIAIVGLFFRLFRGSGFYGRHRWAWTHPDDIRSMSDEEYEQFINKYNRRWGRSEAKSKEEPKSNES